MVAIQCEKVALPYKEFLGLGEGLCLCMSRVTSIHRMQVRHAEKLLLIYSTEALPASEGEIGGAHIHIAFPSSSDPAPPEKTGRRPSVKFAVCETPESMVRQWQKEEDKQVMPSN